MCVWCADPRDCLFSICLCINIADQAKVQIAHQEKLHQHQKQRRLCHEKCLYRPTWTCCPGIDWYVELGGPFGRPYPCPAYCILSSIWMSANTIYKEFDWHQTNFRRSIWWRLELCCRILTISFCAWIFCEVLHVSDSELLMVKRCENSKNRYFWESLFFALARKMGRKEKIFFLVKQKREVFCELFGLSILSKRQVLSFKILMASPTKKHWTTKFENDFLCKDTLLQSRSNF